VSPRVIAAAVVVVMTAGCGQDSNTGLNLPRTLDTDQVVEANEVAQQYFSAAARGDAGRMCAMRTKGALRELGGRAACLREPKPVGRNFGRSLSSSQLAAAEVLPGETRGTGPTAHVMVDYGKATFESGHPVSGKILELDLRLEGGRYKVSRVGGAVFIGDDE
jgi:hypothetical protein